MDEKILITGAARGLGLAMTRELLGRGCHVAVLVRAESDGLKALRASHGDRLSIHRGDVTEEASLRAMFAELAQRLGHLDIIINNAVTYLDGSRPSLEEADLSICARTFEVNAVGPLRVIQQGLPLLRRGQRKLIVNVSSEAGSIGDCRRTTEYAYCMSKSALNMGSKLVQNLLAPEGVQVLALHPGWFNSSGKGPAPISAEEACVKVLQTILKPRALGDAMYVDPEGKPLPW
ncbi:MAG TPA: SDR family NAD(P)-dependent oxidoreductase [Polyangiaceae bacterium]|nr:SDR family NAD(P)-dependent oxidoreductase [Polyangiaceae bacterium]